jgi:hypothetical protein
MERDLHLCELKNLSSISALMHIPGYVWGGSCTGLDMCAQFVCVYSFPLVEKFDVRPKHDSTNIFVQ